MTSPADSHQPSPRRRSSAPRTAGMATLHPPEEWEPLPADANYGNLLLRHSRYRGTVLTNLHLEFGCPQHWAQFAARPTDVIVASFPESGGSWLQELVWRVVSGEVGAESGDHVPLEHRFPLLDAPPENTFMQTVPLQEMKDPRLLRTHLPYHLLPPSVLDSGAKVLYVSRDPREVCVSYYHFSRVFRPHMYSGTFDKFRDSFVRGEVTYGPYREHVQGYLDNADSVLCVTYEQLQQDRAGVVRRVAAFLNRTVTDQEVESIVQHTSFDVMKANPGSNYHHWEKTDRVVTDRKEDNFTAKDVDGGWRSYFTDEESDAFMKWQSEPVVPQAQSA